MDRKSILLWIFPRVLTSCCFRVRMNIFRLTGDLSHLLAIILLLLKIWKSRSCAGELASNQASLNTRYTICRTMSQEAKHIFFLLTFFCILGFFARTFGNF